MLYVCTLTNVYNLAIFLCWKPDFHPKKLLVLKYHHVTNVELCYSMLKIGQDWIKQQHQLIKIARPSVNSHKTCSKLKFPEPEAILNS
jgi:hypothetical protein